MKKKLSIKFILNIAMTILTMASLSVTTYAWFSTVETATVSMFSMHVEESLKCQMKYYTGNYDEANYSYSGYQDIRTLDDLNNASKVTSYRSDFVEIEGNNWIKNGPLDPSNLFTGMCHTYAFEISGAGSQDTTISLTLNKYVSDPSLDERVYKDGVYTDTPITLASAIDIYSSSFVYSSDNYQNTLNANAFITTYMQSSPEDHFTYYDEETKDSSYVLFNGWIPTGATLVVMMTVEFTNLENTYYSSKGVYNNYYYYERNTVGDSNAYQSLTFKMSDISLTRE
ncbi:MAG: hypothetical protein LKF75_00500 [Bacilli bacterium]|jgi:hypothetical protein|nr:hypothetical protein [Bacilli bacterium]MCH4210287.1 hypothetical protein [Bacilli bacterium]MCH4228181.1 hypothetical protein [Bacilli bacterium]MCI2054633.1 hypothetical protein [Bacilli bacterium]